jgi:hypothetical protein
MEKEKILKFIIDNWYIGLGAIVYDILVRIIRTKKNISILDKVYKFLSFIIPNRSVNTTTIIKENTSVGPTQTTTRNHVLKMVVFLMMLSFSGYAQSNPNFKSVRFVNVTDSTTVTAVNGTIYYLDQVNPAYSRPGPKFKIYENNTWSDLLGQGPFVLGNGSGTTADGDHVNLGGPMTSSEVIDGLSSFSLAINDVTNFSLTSGNLASIVGGNGFSVSDNSGAEVASNGFGGLVFNGGGLTINGDAGSAGEFLSSNFTYESPVTGTLNRITSTPSGTSNIINISASYAGQTSITNVGTLTAGTTGVGFNINFTNSTEVGSLGTANGGTGLTAVGSALQVLRTNAAGTALEYATPQTITFGSIGDIPFTNATTNGFLYTALTLEDDAFGNVNVTTKVSTDAFNLGSGGGGISLGGTGDESMRLTAENGATIVFTDTPTDGNLSLNATDDFSLGTPDATVFINDAPDVTLYTGDAYQLAGNGLGGNFAINTGFGFGTGNGGNFTVTLGQGGAGGVGGEFNMSTSTSATTTLINQTGTSASLNSTLTGVESTHIVVQPSDAQFYWANNANTQNAQVQVSGNGIDLVTTNNVLIQSDVETKIISTGSGTISITTTDPALDNYSGLEMLGSGGVDHAAFLGTTAGAGVGVNIDMGVNSGVVHFILDDTRPTPLGLVYGADYSGTFGNESAISKRYNDNGHLSATGTIDFGNTAAQTSATSNITVTGAAVGDPVQVGTPAAPDANSCITAYVSATNTVTVKFNNYSAGAIDPASGSYKVTVFKY